MKSEQPGGNAASEGASGFLADFVAACGGRYQTKNPPLQYRAPERGYQVEGTLPPACLSLMALRQDLYASLDLEAGREDPGNQKTLRRLEKVVSLLFACAKTAIVGNAEKDLVNTLAADGTAHHKEDTNLLAMIFGGGQSEPKVFPVPPSHPFRQIGLRAAAIIAGETDAELTGVTRIAEPKEELGEMPVLVVIEDDCLRGLWSLFQNAKCDVPVVEEPFALDDAEKIAARMQFAADQTQLARDLFWFVLEETDPDLPKKLTIHAGWQICEAPEEDENPLAHLFGGRGGLPPGVQVMTIGGDDEDDGDGACPCGNPDCPNGRRREEPAEAVAGG